MNLGWSGFQIFGWVEAYQKFDKKIIYFADAVAPAGRPSVLGVAKMVELGRMTSILIILGEFGLVWIPNIWVGRNVPEI